MTEMMTPGHKPRPGDGCADGIPAPSHLDGTSHGAPATASTTPPGPPVAAPSLTAPALDQTPLKDTACCGADHTAPLSWWRTRPADAWTATDHDRLRATLRRLPIAGSNATWIAARAGDVTAAIEAALSLAPITAITPDGDLVMSTLASCALAGHAAAALVAAQIVGLSAVSASDGSASVGLAASWFALGLRHTDDPDRFADAWPALMSAFQGPSPKGGSTC